MSTKRPTKKSTKKPTTVRPKFSRVPKSKATNAYELLSEVCQAITEEPKRMNLMNWSLSPKQVVQMKAPPACGTVGCIAGWVTFLKDRMVRPSSYIRERAETLLGDNSWSTKMSLGNLFSPRFSDVPSKPGTIRHAKQVVARIRKYQEVHEAELKARTYEGTTNG